MNFQRLRCFCMIAENKSFSKTASALFISQSAVTQQINALEADMGVKLLDRNTKSVNLTAAGQVFYNEIQKPLQEITNAVLRARTIQNVDERSFTVGCYDTSVERYAEKVMNMFLDQHPDVMPNIVAMRPYHLLPALKALEIDCAFMVPKDVPFRKDQFDFQPLAPQKIYALMSKDHPLANESSLLPEQLKGYTVKTTPTLPYYSTLSVTMNIANANADPNLTFEMTSGKVELMRVRNSKIVLVRPGNTIPEDDTLVAIPLQTDFNADYGLVTLPDCKKVVKDFVKMAASEEMRNVYDL